MAPISVILDTDIGTDVDDCLALALILGSPELKLAAVTAVYGDTRLRARMVMKLLELRGVKDVPVAAGAEKPLAGRSPVHWEGHEGQGLLALADEGRLKVVGRAAELIAQTVMVHPGEITLIAIGPLTNVALAFLLEPRLPQAVAGLTIMGGVVGGALRKAEHTAGAPHRSIAEHPSGIELAEVLPWIEHNFRCDPEAAAIVLASGAPIRLVPLDVTTQVRIRPADTTRIRAVGDPFHLAVADQIDRYPKYQRRGYTYLHDPLAAATVLRPDLVEWELLRAEVQTECSNSAGKLLVAMPSEVALATAMIALDVDAATAESLIVERLVC